MLFSSQFHELNNKAECKLCGGQLKSVLNMYTPYRICPECGAVHVDEASAQAYADSRWPGLGIEIPSLPASVFRDSRSGSQCGCRSCICKCMLPAYITKTGFEFSKCEWSGQVVFSKKAMARADRLVQGGIWDRLVKFFKRMFTDEQK